MRLTVVVPVYNEAKALPELLGRLAGVACSLPHETTLLFIDDGSSDNSLDIISGWSSPHAKIELLELARNFGHQAALTAGLDHADGDIVVTMDGDGQHPPELIPKLIALFDAGNDIVLTQRVADERLGPVKRATSGLFYWLLNRISETDVLAGSADFRLLSRHVVLELRQMREYHRFLRGMVAWMGYRVAVLPFEAPQRIAGRSSYSSRKMLKLAADAIVSFSVVPISLSIVLGLFSLLVGVAEMLYVLGFWISGRQAELVPGWSSLMFVLLVLGGILLIMLGIIGYYVGGVFQQVKGRPIYLLRKSVPEPKHTSKENRATLRK